MPDTDYAKIIARSDRFRDFRDSEEMKVCFVELEEQFVEKWAETDTPEVAQELWHRVRALRQIRTAVDACVADGDVARKEASRYGKEPDSTPKKTRSRKKI